MAVLMERLRRAVLSPLFDRLGYDLVPAAPDWTHRPVSRREVDVLLRAAAESLERDLTAAGIATHPRQAQVPSPVREGDRVRDAPSPERSGPSPQPSPTRERGPVAPTEAFSTTISSEGVRALTEEFWALIPSAPVRQRRGGSGFNGALQLFVAMRALKPAFVIESGVFRGLTTWVIRQALPEAQLFCHDPDLSGLQYRDARARYDTADWSRADWSGLDPGATVAFFDDHVSQARRVIEAQALGLTRLLFDDDAAGHRIHAHGGPAHPTIAMLEAMRDDPEPIRWRRNGRVFEQADDDPLGRRARGCIARSHAFDDLHQATGYSPARLTYVVLHPPARGRGAS